MAKITSRRRLALDDPEGMLTLAERLWEPVRPYAKWLISAGVVIVVGLAAWGINARIQGGREEKASAALALVVPKANLNAPNAAVAGELEKFVKQYPGTAAAREAQLLRANLLYGLGQYGAAAKAYETLLDSRDPGWDALVNESLSYCYEGLGNYKQAAAILKPVVEQAHGPLKAEIMRRLAMLYDEAKEPREAAIYWRKLLDQLPDPALLPYLQEKLAAAEAASKK